MTTLNGTATRLRDRFPEGNVYIRWNADTRAWSTIAEPLGDQALQDHATGRIVVGMYPAVDGVARAATIDIDLHLDRDPTPEEVAIVDEYARKKHRELTSQGIDAVLLRHHLHGSYHITLFTKPLAADRLGRWLRWIVADAGEIHVDTFPSVTGGGNAVRLPGRHHRRPDNWTEVLLKDGTWGAWPTCVSELLALRENTANQFPDPGKAKNEPAPPPPEPSADNRKRAVDAIAGCWPTIGARHEAGLALAGGLLRAGFLVRWVEEFVRAIGTAAGDDETEKRVRCVADTQAKLDNGEKVTGWPRLAEVLRETGGPVVSAVRGWLGITDPIPVIGKGKVSGDLGDGGSANAPPWKPPTPLPEMPPVPAFPIHLFPAKVADYWLASAESLGYPVDYIAVPAIPLLGAATGRSLAVELKRTYKESPILWCGLVAPPGAAKSASLTFAQGPLPIIAAGWVADYKSRMKEHRKEKIKYEQEVKEWKNAKCQGEAPEEPELPTVRQLVYGNFTVETLIRGNHANPRGVAICKDELSGLVDSLNQYKQGKGDDRQNLLSMWAGVGINYNREKDRVAGIPPLTLPHTFLGVAGMIQPDLLTAFRGDVARKSFVNDGWADRFLLSFPDPPLMSGENWRTVSEELEAGYAEVFKEMLGWEMIPVQDNEGNVITHLPYDVPFDRYAERVWEEFTCVVATRMNLLEPFDSYRGVLSKSKHHTLRLTAAIHAIRRACGEVTATAPVTANTVQRAVDLMAYFEAHGKRCLGVGWLGQAHRVARRMLDWFARHPEMHTFTRSDAFGQLKDEKDVQQARQLDETFQLLVDLNYLRPFSPTLGAVGRPAEAYRINPAWARKPQNPIPNIPKNLRSVEVSGDFGDGVSGNRRSEEPSAAVNEGEPPITTPTPDTGEPPVMGGTIGGAGSEESPRDATEAPVSAYRLIAKPEALVPPAVVVTDWAGPVGLDCETTGLDPARDRVRLIQLAIGAEVSVIDVFSFPDPAAALAPLFAALAAKEVVGHNLVAFDLPFLARLGFTPTRVFDTAIASRTIYAGEDGKHGLADAVQRELGVTLDKSDQKSDWGQPILSREQLAYAASDVTHLVPLADKLREKARERKIEATIDLEMLCAVPIARMGARGIGFDSAAWVGLADGAIRRRDELVVEMDDLAPNPGCLAGMGGWNWNSQGDVKKAFATLGVTIESTEEETIAELNHPLAKLLLEYKGTAKLTSSYGRKFAEEHVTDGRMYATWNQTGAKTGRMSCKSPNLQQVPRDPAYRRCFVAGPGHVLIKCDFSQIELRVAAAVTGDKRMRAAYENGEDLHTLTAARFLGVSLGEVTKDARQMAKPVNFGAIYGLGSRSLRRKAKSEYGKDMTEKQARGFLNAFFAEYPGVRVWHNKLKRDNSTAVRTLAKRRIAVGSDQFYGAKANYIVQGTAGDGLKRAIVLLHERREECPSAELLLAVHDELVIEVPEADAEHAKEWLSRCMIDAMQPLMFSIPVAVETSVGRTWAGGDHPVAATRKAA